MPESTEKKSYKDTLNLPKTAFAMKANLVQNEPASLKRWTEGKLYERIRQARAGSPRFAFHDGPPYANGLLHVGHLLNKILKDFVVRAKTMSGFDVPYIPGWDCHGLPIESKVQMDLGPEKARAMVPLQIRKRCRDSAEKFIKQQMVQMQRLLTLADYAHPYITMDPAYEAGVLEVFANLVGQGVVYRALKPVHWSIDNRTALAEAELEYYTREDTSVYALFEVKNLAEGPEVLRRVVGTHRVYLMVWTTTPWTLPANMAVAVHPQYEYGVFRLESDPSRFVIVAKERESRGLFAGIEKADRPTDLAALAMAGPNTEFMEIRKRKLGERLAVMPGAALTSIRYQHPFIDRVSPVVTADYVTLEDGTGLVHTAPGHGVEDYQTGLREGLPIYCPVKEDGTFDDTAPEWLRGVDVWNANGLVIERLRQSGNLFHDHKFTHSYPHDWRGKTPTIFRATEQWFIGVDRPLAPRALERGEGKPASAGAGEGGSGLTLRQLAIRATEHDITFHPEWGRNRLRGMLESRPDWCISRQRAWGLPIPAFFPPEGESVPADQMLGLLTEASVRAVAAKVRQHGSDCWFKATAAELLADYDVAQDQAAPAWLKDFVKIKGAGYLGELVKSSDIFDVWLESGSSWHAVMRQRDLAQPGDRPVTDLYLEGSDQHRGWFQTSLLPAVAVTGHAPFSEVVTHGWTLDKDGRKMSKSLGNTLEVEALLKEFGADVCRWWVSSVNTDNDIRMDKGFFTIAGEEYRKIRNTIKYLLSNLYDFQPDKDSYKFTDADGASLDAWALNELAELVEQVRGAYDAYEFRRLHEALFNFCNDTMSAVYLAATKDRMYCDPPGSARRRRSQTAMFKVADALIRLLAPLLPHTAEEAWTALHAGAAQLESVHLALFPDVQDYRVPLHAAWAQLMAERDAVLKVIESGRSTQNVDNPLDIGLNVDVGEKARWLRQFDPIDLADLFQISRVTLRDEATDAGAAIYTAVDLRADPRCERSWKRDGTVKQRSDGGLLSDRDAAALGLV